MDPSYMDMMVMQQYGMPQAPRSNMQPAMTNNNPAASAMQGSSLPNSNPMSDLTSSRPGLGNALNNALLTMSMMPTGMTIGENIKNFSGALTELPYAKLAHAYQMLNPGMQMQQQQAQIAELQGAPSSIAGRTQPGSPQRTREV